MDKKQTIIMTGHAGDVGSVLFSKFKENGFKIIPYDKSTGTNAQCIIHLAAFSPPAPAELMIQSNISFLQEIISYASCNNIPDFIFFSAAAIYGNADAENLDEAAPSVNPSMYALTKLLGESLLRESPLNSLCLRLPAILSIKNDTNIMSRFYKMLANDQEIILCNAEKAFNNFISIEDIFKFILNISFVKKHDVVNLAANRTQTLFETVEIMKKHMKSHSNITRSVEKQNLFNLSIDKAVKEYGYEPSNVETMLHAWIDAKNVINSVDEKSK